MTYYNYGSDQLGNENKGVGRRSEVDEGTDKARLGICPDKDLDIVFISYGFIFPRCFFFFLFTGHTSEFNLLPHETNQRLLL